MSIAGGYHKAVEAGKKVGCDCIQVFTKNNNQWKAKPITPEEAEQFKTAVRELAIGHPISHDSYLINLAAPEDELWQKSVAAFVIELQRAEQLGLAYVVAHPGAFTTTNEEVGIARIVAALDEVHRQTPRLKVKCLLENTAGQGSNLGWRFEHLAAVLRGVAEPGRLGVCIDTCHLLAAGYPLSRQADYEATFDEFDRVVGLEQIKAFHLNDSKKELGSRVDRHEHIGEGKLGLEAFRLLLTDERFAQIPMYLETPKGTRDGVDLDAMNLATLRSLLST